jgi:hypothetical protein
MTNVSVRANGFNGQLDLFSSRTASAVVALVKAGNHGRTAAEVSIWAYRFAAYCHDLRHRHGLDIRTDREKHPSGWHDRHVLVTSVEIVCVDEMEAAA